MSALDEIKREINSLSAGERARLMESLNEELGETIPGIESRIDVNGGEACIIRTRIPVWLLEQARRLGASEADLLRNYPSLRAEDLVHAWSYVRIHREEIDQQIRENEAA